MSTNPRRTIVAIAGSAGAYTEVDVHTNGAQYAEISEVPASPSTGGAYTGQGLNYTLPDDNFVQIYSSAPGVPIIFGNRDSMGRSGAGRGLGFGARPNPGQNSALTIPATPLCKIISATVTATQVQLLEWI